MSFSVTKEGTTALCELNFSTDLTIVSSASVRTDEYLLKITYQVSLFLNKVSCQILHDLQGTQTAIGETTHTWTFYTDIGLFSLLLTKK